MKGTRVLMRFPQRMQFADGINPSITIPRPGTHEIFVKDTAGRPLKARKSKDDHEVILLTLAESAD